MKTQTFRKGDVVMLRHGKVKAVSNGVREAFFPENPVIGKTMQDNVLVDTDPDLTSREYKVMEVVGETAWLEDVADKSFNIWAFKLELIMIKAAPSSVLRQIIGYVFGYPLFFFGVVVSIMGNMILKWAGVDIDEGDVGTVGSALEATVP